jgi:hypothetical protein
LSAKLLNHARDSGLIRATYLDIRDALHTPPQLCNTDTIRYFFIR